jgi:hypothetical protein
LAKELVIFKIFIRIYMFWPPTAAFTTTTPLWYAHRLILVILPPARREELFRHEVFKLLKAEGKIADVIIENMMNWPPARRAYRAYASESATADSTFIAVLLSGRTMNPPEADLKPLLSMTSYHRRAQMTT